MPYDYLNYSTVALRLFLLHVYCAPLLRAHVKFEAASWSYCLFAMANVCDVSIKLPLKLYFNFIFCF